MEVTNQKETCSLTTYKNYANKSALDISFRNISYTVGKGKNIKRILNQISGAFDPGKLTAILGPSGAGKTSLMNILAGLKIHGVEGCVEINDEKQEVKTFRKQSAYIPQKDHLLQDLSVDEYMMSASHLKLGNNVSNKEKKLMIEMILKTLGLINSQRTRISNLSGGERKRLSIGLELFDNPAVLFLDEPTSGLDSSSSMQCINLLREIARSGRTVVATIHQPSSRLLDHFDNLYIMAKGSCIYQGPTGSLVSYLKKFNLNCPSYHNPADFVMDVAIGEYGDVLFQLTSGVENGRLIYNEISESILARPYSQDDIVEYSSIIRQRSESLNKVFQEKNGYSNKDQLAYAAPFRTQVSVLVERTWRSIFREKMLTKVRFITNIGFALFFGLAYQFIGNNASLTLNNAGMLFFNQVFIVFTSVMPTIVTFPMERKVLAREHLNHWYSLKAYYLAKMLVDIPFQIIFPTVYLVIVYFMTSQPLSFERFSMLLFITICMSLVGQGVGLFFGTAFGIQSAVFLGPTCAIPFFLFSGYFINLNSVPPYLNWITRISLFRFGFEGSMLAIYDDRPPLECPQPYCYFRSPTKFLESFAMEQSSYLICIIGMLAYFFVLRFAGYFLLRSKLKTIR